MVPLFQRPYVWNQESQWEPLWDDLVRVANRLLEHPGHRPQPHFLGAVVLQQTPTAIGHLAEWTIIDGQQRLTTLQLLLDALHAELVRVEATQAAKRIEDLIQNGEAYRAKAEDRFKVWPTNRDREAFNAVMAATPPVDHDATGHKGSRMVEAHRFFSAQARKWIAGAPPDPVTRANAIETAVRELMQMVVIDLGPDENAQEIFETLNARGAQLTAADLIKNFVFQRLQEAKADVEEAYKENWAEFETGFWEEEISIGRVRHARSAVFLNHWLVARTGEEVVAREVFKRFKNFADFEIGLPMTDVIRQVRRSAAAYRSFVTSASNHDGKVDRQGLFAYRTSMLESEVIKPLALHLLDPERPASPLAQLSKAFVVLESWMVRRMLVRATTKNYNQIVPELIKKLPDSDRTRAGDVIESLLAGQTSGSGYWPDDDELRSELRTLPIYRRIGRGRLRMVLEAVEDHLRGWVGDKAGLGGQRVPRAAYTIEHVMPRKWARHWPGAKGARAEAEREAVIHTLGNLTLLTSRLNPKLSNAPWLGRQGKKALLHKHDVLHLNKRLLDSADRSWDEESIRRRTAEMIEAILEIWPVPPGHRAVVDHPKKSSHRKIDVVDLISAGMLTPGMTLVPRVKKYASQFATLLSTGHIDVAGAEFETPSAAARAIKGGGVPGWWFFLVSESPRKSLQEVRRAYMESLDIDPGEDGDDDEAQG
jgi:hypothetical protein